ncbi:hypothetical protein, partial [Pseudomonas helleri]
KAMPMIAAPVTATTAATTAMTTGAVAMPTVITRKESTVIIDTPQTGGQGLPFCLAHRVPQLIVSMHYARLYLPESCRLHDCPFYSKTYLVDKQQVIHKTRLGMAPAIP